MNLLSRLAITTSLLALSLVASTTSAFACGAYGSDPSVTLRVTPEREYVYRGGSREVIVEVEVKARKPKETFRTPVNVSLVLDRSGSMEGAKIEKARQAAKVALDRLDAEDFFSLVIYDNAAEVFIEPERVGSRAHREMIKERIERIMPRGSTALHAGVTLGAKQVRQFLDKERVNRVILLSDGLANVGPRRTSDLVELGRSLRGEKISVTTIGLGEDFNEDLMTGLAEASHANYYYVKDTEKLPAIFSEELGSATSRVASEIRIRIQVPAGVRVEEILGHPEIRVEKQVAEISMPELFGSEHRLFHVRCRLDDTTPEIVAVAAVSLAYEDAVTRKALKSAANATVRLSDDAKRAETSVQDETARNVAVLQNRLDKEAAVRLADAGRAKEAAAILEQRANLNASAPAAQQIPANDAEIRQQRQWAQELSSGGKLGNTSRKAAQWDNYQDRYQKK
jgi:Ca-activated chloride channel family protein